MSAQGGFSMSLTGRVFGFSLRILGLAAAILAVHVPHAAAARCPAGMVAVGNKCGIPVTTSFEFFDSQGALSTISNDSSGVYTHGGGVLSYLLDDGVNGLKHDWRFDVRGTTRRVVETLSQADRVTSGPHYTAWANDPPYWGTVGSEAMLNVQCTALFVDMLAMPAGQSRTCALINTFYYNGDDYRALNPAKSWTGFAETTDVQVTCNSTDSMGCKDWTIDPFDEVGGVGVQAVGRLVHHQVLPRGKTATESDGDFLMRFHIHITRP
jgi:hypothetical protein